MGKKTVINDEISILESEVKKRSRIYVIDRGVKILLSSDDIYVGYYHGFGYDENYIVTYSFGSMAFPVPLSINSAYNIKNHKKVDISNNEIRSLLEKMIVCKKCFNIDEVLTEINPHDLGLMDEENKGRLHDFLTSGNEAIPQSDVINYIFNLYPELRKYSSLASNISVAEYRRICQELGNNGFDFHAMSQQIEPEGTGLKLLYTAKKEDK